MEGEYSPHTQTIDITVERLNYACLSVTVYSTLQAITRCPFHSPSHRKLPLLSRSQMASTHYDYDVVAIHEMEVRLREEDNVLCLFFQCPCGDEFVLTVAEFAEGKRVAQCPTCSLTCAIECTEEESRKFCDDHRVGITA